MSNISELRDMSDEQLGLTLREAAENLFRLRLQAQTERLDAPSELRKFRRLIARARTLQRERESAAPPQNAGTAEGAKPKRIRLSRAKRTKISV